MRKLGFGMTLAVPLLFPPLAADDGPAKAGEFVAWCNDHAGGCADRIGSVEDSLVASRDKRYCAPKDGNVTDGIAKVHGWLAAHPEMNARDTDAAIADGWVALFPCQA
jgi:hypothetical protein